MTSLYAIRYLGQSGVGVGSICMGNGALLGIDIGGGHYKGMVKETANRLQATFTLSMPLGGVLVTGQTVPPGTTLPLSADWPKDFANGQPLSISVMGKPVQVTVEKIGDLP